MNRLMVMAIWMAVIVVASFLLYRVKYEVQGLRAQIAQTSRELEQEKEALHVVAAEWAYLNRPQRLEYLANKYLASQGVTVRQVAEIEAIDFPKQETAQDTPPSEPANALPLVAASYHRGASAP
jgi:hypothetical protein